MNIEHILKATQMAVDIVGQSPHPDNKVAACAFTEHHAIARTNEWPERIEKNIGTSTRIGDSSGTIHAETNCLLHFPDKTDGASLAITDPCCPNCAKCIAEAGIKNIYIDHKGFTKDFASRRGDEFKNMSMSILVHAGINVYEVNRKEKPSHPSMNIRKTISHRKITRWKSSHSTIRKLPEIFWTYWKPFTSNIRDGEQLLPRTQPDRHSP